MTIGKPRPNVDSNLGDIGASGDVRHVGEGGRAAAGEFEVEWQCQVEGFWGAPAVAYVHHRHPP